MLLLIGYESRLVFSSDMTGFSPVGTIGGWFLVDGSGGNAAHRVLPRIVGVVSVNVRCP